jgi:hypothetical protein
MDKRPIFAINVGYNLGNNFHRLKEEIQDHVLENITGANSNYAYGLGEGLAEIFRPLSQDVRQKIWKVLKSNMSFAKIRLD